MKLKRILFTLFIALMVLGSSVLGYETDNYSITVDESFEQTQDQGLVMFQNPQTGDNIVIQKIEQKILGGKLTTFQLNQITEEISKQYKELYDATVEQVGKEEVTINNKNVTRMTYKTDIEDTVIYQELNIFVENDGVYDIIFTAISDEGFSREYKDNILNSFQVKENTSSESSANTTGEDASDELGYGWTEFGYIIIISIVLIIAALKLNNKSKLFVISIVLLIVQGFILTIDGIDGKMESNMGFNLLCLAPSIVAIILLIIQMIRKPKKQD
ncbi:MAG: hypothetical protein IJ223_05150 [Clostridia bacterium]|nr:hypothetical protein [Clostridia bacterium]